ncbi:MAG: hypothetical protein ABW170_18680 [Candidatus Thiodiazotropha sp. L084R]
MNCIICNTSSHYFFTKQFNCFGLKNVDYYRCNHCGSVFAKTLLELAEEDKRVFDLVMLFGTSESPKSTRPLTAYCAPTVLRTSRFRIAQTQQAAGALLHHDSRK